MNDREGNLALYLHLPFCDRRCPYCHFTCFVNRDPSLPLRYVKALAVEFDRARRDVDAPIGTVYVGGGTPTALEPRAREWICRWFAEELAGQLAPNTEITLEVNPESAWPESLDPWIEAGVNRLSLGIQSMDPQVLDFLGRLNTPASNRRALSLAAERVENLSVDFILATPGSSMESMEAGLRLVEEFPISHVSAYLLEIHGKTRFGREVESGRWEPLPGDEQARRYLYAVRWLQERGFQPYELSNFARDGKVSRHNQAYWSGASYLGLGVSAHSHHRGVRWWNVQEVSPWLERIEAGRLPIAGRERLNAKERREEELLLGLRTRRGVPVAGERGHRALWEQWIRAGYALRDGGRYRLTPAGWLVMDEIVLRLLRAEDAGRPGFAAGSRAGDATPPGELAELADPPGMRRGGPQLEK